MTVITETKQEEKEYADIVAYYIDMLKKRKSGKTMVEEIGEINKKTAKYYDPVDPKDLNEIDALLYT